MFDENCIFVLTIGERFLKTLNKRVILNSIKIIIAAVWAIMIAKWAGLNYYISAGVVTILTIQPTKKETLKTAMFRCMAFVLSIVISYVSFSIFGFTTPAFLVYLGIYVLICESLHWYGAVTVNAVLIAHMYYVGNMNAETILNEVCIFCVGIGIGILANLHLRKNKNYIEEMKEATDKQIQRILVRMSERILNHDMSDYNGECFYELRTRIRKAKNVAESNYNNQFGYGDIYDLEYISMRDKQYQVLYEMYSTVRHMDMSPAIADKISHFLKETAENYRQVENAIHLMEKFRELDKEMKSSPLPEERKDFENRAYLFVLMRHMEELLQIKIDFANKHILGE